MAKASTQTKPPTKSEIFSQISDKTGLAKRDVSEVFDELEPIMKKSLKQNGEFSLPGLCKMEVKSKAKVPAGERRNPFTGETKWMPAKPASKQVKVKPLKKVKDMV